MEIQCEYEEECGNAAILCESCRYNLCIIRELPSYYIESNKDGAINE